MKSISIMVLTVLTVAFERNALGQLPESRIITVDVAQTMAQEAMATCCAQGFKVTVLVVDSLNAPKALLRDDGANASTTEIARMKATSTMVYDRPSGPSKNRPPGTPALAAVIPGTVNFQGALPIKVGSATIGAIAVSGAPHGEQDAGCASAALAKFADKLK
jgi:uncharacterized protein GlcG (DUF336 family)